MNKFKESLKVNLDEKEQREYEEYKRKRFSKVVQNPKWDIAKNRMKVIKKIIEKIKNIFSLPPCPECNGKVKSEYLDMTIDKLVFKCTKCGKEYIGL